MTPEQIAAAQSAFPDQNAPPQPGPYVGAYGLPSPQLVSGAQSAFDQNNAPNMSVGGPVPPMQMMSQQPPVSAAQAAFDPVPPSPPGTPPLAPMVPTGAPMPAQAPSQHPAANGGMPFASRGAPGAEQQYRMAQKDTMQSYKDEIRATGDVTEAARKKNEADSLGKQQLASMHDQNAKDMFDMDQQAQAHHAEFDTEYKKAAADVSSYKFDPYKNERGKGVGSKLAFVIGAALGGALQGMGKTSGNTFLEHADHLVDTETKRQQMEYEQKKGAVSEVGNRYAYWMKKYGDARQAKAMTQAELEKGVQSHIEAAAAQSNDPAIKANGDLHARELGTQFAEKTEQRMKVNADQARAAAAAAAAARRQDRQDLFAEQHKNVEDQVKIADLGIKQQGADTDRYKAENPKEAGKLSPKQEATQFHANMANLDRFENNAHLISPSVVQGIPGSADKANRKQLQDEYKAQALMMAGEIYKKVTGNVEPKNHEMVEELARPYIPQGEYEPESVTRGRIAALKKAYQNAMTGNLGTESPYAAPAGFIKK